jgi:hypothetical protein
MHLLMRAERDGIKDVWHGRSLSRLADSWRGDVRAAGDASLEDAAPETPRVLLTRPDGLEVAYAVDRHAVTRLATRGDAVEHRDAFYFPPGSTIRFAIDGEPRMARIVIRRPMPPNNKPQPAERPTADTSPATEASEASLGRVTTIQALLSRDLRYNLQEPSQ